MGLNGFEKSYPYQISGGMASRCAIARTFIQEPGLILLDEPLSALDAFTRMVIQDEIVRLHEQTSSMFLLVTHDIEEAVYLCDRVIVMSARPGRKIAEVSIDLPRPRNRVSDEFVALRREVLSQLNSVKSD
jgi:sulfonate transport system ATP-binding protein